MCLFLYCGRNIQDQGGKEEDAAEGGGHERDVDDFTAEFGEDTHDDEDEIRNGLAENSIGGGFVCDLIVVHLMKCLLLFYRAHCYCWCDA